MNATTVRTFAVLLAMLAACSRPETRPAADANAQCPGCNVVLISLDTLRADHLGAYGYPKPTSPCIDRFASESIRFDLSFSQSTWTLPSHMSMLTSLYPGQHGMVATDRRLPKAVPVLTEILRDHGYTTAAFTAGGMMAAKFGFDRGFEIYKESYRNQENSAPGQGRRLREMIGELSGWIDTNGDDPFFLLVHSYDVHAPYLVNDYLTHFEDGYSGKLSVIDQHDTFVASELYRTNAKHMAGDSTLNTFYGAVLAKGRVELSDTDRAHVIALYDGEIRQVDDHFCRLWNKLKDAGLMERTIVILTSDHGETLFERGDLGHGGHPYEDLIRVPLIVRLPGHAPGVSDKLAQGIDIAPTVLRALGLPSVEAFLGRALLPLESAANEFVAAESGGDGKGAAIRTRRYKLIVYPDMIKLFDLEADPKELRDVSDEYPSVVAQLKGTLWPVLDRVELDEKTREHLGALGYVE